MIKHQREWNTKSNKECFFQQKGVAYMYHEGDICCSYTLSLDFYFNCAFCIHQFCRPFVCSRAPSFICPLIIYVFSATHPFIYLQSHPGINNSIKTHK